jgi:predicted Zn-dependent protease
VIPGSDEARATLDLCLRSSRADACVAAFSGREGGHVRFALGEPSTAGDLFDLQLSVRCSFGRRSAVFTTHQIDPDAIVSAVRSAEALARLSPEDPEALPPPGPQVYGSVDAWSAATAEAGASRRAGLVSGFASPGRSMGLTAAGICSSGARFLAVASSAGLHAWHRATHASLTGTMRTGAGSGSGWAGAFSTRIEAIDAASLAAIASRKAVDSASPAPIPPGRYTVILEPAAVADLLPFVVPALDARRVAEGRSPFSRPGGGDARGERIAAPGVTLVSDPAEPSAPSAPFDAEGSPLGKMDWIADGVLSSLSTTRSWAAKTGLPHRPAPTNLVLRGGASSLEEMIRATDRGLLVTRFGYARLVDPQSLFLTGFTRDGLFLIDRGRLVGSVRNLRFNESLPGILARADMIGPARAFGEGADPGSPVILAPALRSRDFSFTSASEAV